MVMKKFIYLWSTREFHSTLTLLLRYPLKVSHNGGSPHAECTLSSKESSKKLRVVSGRRWHLLVIKLSRCLEISCK